MSKSVLIYVFFLTALAGQTFGFVFHDPGTCAELVAFKASQYGQMAQELGYSAEQIAKLQQQIQKFQEYKAQFDRYYGTFATCYRAINSGNWQGLATTINTIYQQELARRQEEIDEAEANNIQQQAEEAGLISAASRINGDQVDQTIRALQDTVYYRQNPEVKRMVDEYTSAMEAGYRYHNSFLDKVAAILRTIQTHNATIARLEQKNQELSTGDDQQSLVAQLALNNQLLLESLKLQAEMATLNALLAGHQADSDITYQKTNYNEMEGQATRTGVMDQLLAPLQDSAPAPKRKR